MIALTEWAWLDRFPLRFVSVYQQRANTIQHRIIMHAEAAHHHNQSAYNRALWLWCQDVERDMANSLAASLATYVAGREAAERTRTAIRPPRRKRAVRP